MTRTAWIHCLSSRWSSLRSTSTPRWVSTLHCTTSPSSMASSKRWLCCRMAPTRLRRLLNSSSPQAWRECKRRTKLSWWLKSCSQTSLRRSSMLSASASPSIWCSCTISPAAKLTPPSQVPNSKWKRQICRRSILTMSTTFFSNKTANWSPNKISKSSLRLEATASWICFRAKSTSPSRTNQRAVSQCLT